MARRADGLVVQLGSGGAARGAGVVAVLEGIEAEIRSGRQRRPDVQVGTSISAWHALALSANRVDELRPLYEGIRGRRDVLKWDWNPAGGVGPSLDAMIDLAEREGLGEGMKAPTFVGVVDLTALDVVTGPSHLPGHRLVRVDTLSPAEARLWAARSSCQRPVMRAVDGHRKRDGARWIDGGWRAMLPPIPDEYLDKTAQVLAVACSPLEPQARTGPREPNEVNGDLECAQVLLDDVVDHVAARDYQRLRDYAASGISVTLWSPPTMAEVGRSFDLSPDTLARRLDVVGPRAWLNRQVL